jgi:hypothetical protein
VAAAAQANGRSAGEAKGLPLRIDNLEIAFHPN